MALLLAVGCWTAQAQEAYKINPAQSEVHFTLTDVLHVVHGTFRVQQGDIVFNPTAGTMGGSVAVDARSGESGNNVRDRRMTEDELKAPTYSTVTFAPKRFKGTIPQSGDAKIEVDVEGLCTRATALRVINAFMRSALPSIERCLPDWKKLKSPAAPVSHGTGLNVQ